MPDMEIIIAVKISISSAFPTSIENRLIIANAVTKQININTNTDIFI